MREDANIRAGSDVSTINKVIERVARTKPNALAEQDQVRYLIELDRRIYEEIIRGDEPERVGPRRFPEDGDMELVVGEPYDNLYDHYLTAMIEYWMREYDAYNNTTALFMQAYDEFRARWRRDHRPRETAPFRVMH